MNAERIVRIVAGGFVLLSLALGVEASPLFVSKYFLFFTAFVGLNLFQSGFTQICPLNNILARLGVKGSC
jgi:Inner membrane protein YgaP-like, transmembrane domain